MSGDQRLHEAVKVADLWRVPVSDAMHTKIVSANAASTLNEFVGQVNAHPLHASYPVYEDGRVAGVMPMRYLSKTPASEWDHETVGALMERNVTRVAPECDLMEAARLLNAQRELNVLLVVSSAGKLDGIITHSDLLTALNVEGRDSRSTNGSHSPHPVEVSSHERSK